MLFFFSGINIYHKAMMPQQNHGCKNSNCSHICLLGLLRTATCACRDDMELIDEFTCQAKYNSENIVFGVGPYIASVVQKKLGRYESIAAQKFHSPAEILAYDSLNGEIFAWGNQSGKIVKVNLESWNETVLVDQVVHVKGMAFGKSFNLEC